MQLDGKGKALVIYTAVHRACLCFTDHTHIINTQ